jgi:fatty-acid desaturase
MARKTGLRSLSSHFYFIFLPTHLLFAWSFYQHIVQPQAATWLFGSIIVWAVLSGLGIAIGYHRLLSHRSFQASIMLKRILASIGILAGQGSPIFWTSVHRGQHHPHSDTDRDPHSPLKGRFHAFLGWQFFFCADDFDPRYAIDLVRDPFLRKISQHYYWVFWIFTFLIASCSWSFFIYCYLPGLFVSVHQENIVNALCHVSTWGYRNFEVGDRSRNLWILGTVFFGQGFHNNHHAHPQRYNFGVHAWEIDFCRWIVPVLMWFDGGWRKASAVLIKEPSK